VLRIHQVPQIEVKILETQDQIGGIEELGTPPSMPALTNTIFDLTEQHAHDLPLNKLFNFAA
jgi:isoquinoline 1-oxidoreductase beta subunit